MEVRVENLTKAFPGTVAVNNVSLTFQSGKLSGLLGPSGCGKSTTLFLIAGLHEPTSGKIYFGDEDVTDVPPEKRGIGLVFQNYALYPHMTVEKNILFPLQNMKVPKDEALDRAYEMAKLVQIENLMKRKPAELSGGQQQRVAIARALVKHPRILLLDEPLSNLDARLRLEMRQEIKRIQQEVGITTIFVTHDQEEAMSICDEIIVMDRGNIMQVDQPQKLYTNPNSLFVAKFLGNPPINVTEAVVKDKKVLVNDAVVDTVDLPDQPVHFAFRPEDVLLYDDGPLQTEIQMVEHIGRDTMIICQINGTQVRGIIDSEIEVSAGQTVRFGFKKNRYFLFSKATGERLR
ncbi:MAG TPA: ABC transporter ATP-binding protein [Haloplasmataceae bacterium]